jgi:hypothetical protein
MLPGSFDDVLKLLTAVGGVGTFAWGVFQWDRNQKAQAEQKKQDAVKGREQRRLEAQKPFLDLQLALYSDVMEITSIIPTKMMSLDWATDKGAELDSWIGRFWSLYYGKLAMVENREVEAAMVNYGRILLDMIPDSPSAEAVGAGDAEKPILTDGQAAELARTQIGKVQQASLKLARAMRESLDESWNINVWTDKK